MRFEPCTGVPWTDLFSGCGSDGGESGPLKGGLLTPRDVPLSPGQNAPFVDGLNDASDAVLGPWIGSIAGSVQNVIKSMSTFFVSMPDPNVGDPDTGVPSASVGFLQSSLAPIAGVIMIVALIIGSAKLMHSERPGSFREMVAMLVRYVLTAGLAIPVTASALIAADAVARWLLDRSIPPGTTFGDNLMKMLAPGGTLTGVFAIIGLVLAGLASLLLCVMLVFRNAMVIILLGTILITAAYSNTESGGEAFRKHIGALIAYVIWKAAAALVFASAFRMMSTDLAAPDGVTTWCAGMATLIMAILALPALMRVIVGAVAPAASGRGFGGSVAGMAVGVRRF